MPQESGNSNGTDIFNHALALQQEKKFDDALTEYQKFIDQSRETLSDNQAAVAYHNMSTIANQKGDLLRAYIWSKKALHLDAGNTQARESYEYYAKKVEIPNIPHQISNTDNIKKAVGLVPVDLWFLVSLFLVFGTIRLAFKKYIAVKRDRVSGIYGQQTIWPVYLLGIFAIISIATSAVSYLESSKQSAIIIAEKAQIQTVPGENKTVIFEAQAGLELEVLASDGNYLKVRYPGAFTGWVNKSQLELLSLRFRQGE